MRESDSDWLMTSYLVLSVDKHPSTTLQANPAPTSVDARETVDHSGAGLVSQTSMAVQINFVSFSWCYHCSEIYSKHLHNYLTYQKLKALCHQPLRKLEKWSHRFELSVVDTFQNVHPDWWYTDLKVIILSNTNYNVLKNFWSEIYLPWIKVGRAKIQKINILTVRLSVWVSVSVSDVRHQNPLCPL